MSFTPHIRHPSRDPADLQRAVIDLINKSNQDEVLPGSSRIQITETPSGKVIDIPSTPPIAAGDAGAAATAYPLNMVFRGEHSQFLNYNANDCVLVSNGDAAGFYIAPHPLVAGSAIPGSVDSEWVLIGDGSTSNVWL